MTRHSRLLAVWSAVMLWAACPPLGLAPLAFAALAPLIRSVAEAPSVRAAAFRGYLFGLVYLGAVWYWTGLTVQAWTGSLVGWVGWFLLTLILALYYAAWAAAARLISARCSGLRQALLISAAWVVMEWARTVGTLTMPWAQLSYTQYRFPPALQIASLTGAYGVSFLICFINSGVEQAARPAGPERSTRTLWAAGCTAIFALLYGLARLTMPIAGTNIRVADLQGNFGVMETAQSAEQSLRRIKAMSSAAARRGPSPELMVWSESAAPNDALHAERTRSTLQALADRLDTGVLIGSRITSPDEREEWNASVLFAPGLPPTVYQKQQLVPFGEFLPFRNKLPAFLDDTFHFARNDVTPGQSTAPMSMAKGRIRIGPFICYESMYPQYARRLTRGGANILATQSNDAWFQSRTAMEQHLAAVVLRAVENSRYVIRSTTSGITCLIDADGRIYRHADLNVPATIVDNVLLRTGQTPYARFGDWFVACCALALALAVRRPSAQPEREPPVAP